MHTLKPIGKIRTPYKEKFAIPRQPSLAPDVVTELHLIDEVNNEATVRELEQFSHLWLLFLFDQNIEAGWKPTVRPPRLGGNKRVGVFASRSTFRPNAIGMSAVELKEVVIEKGNVVIRLGNVDLVDGTPIIDIKPYIPYSDSIPEAQGGYAEEAPQSKPVSFTEDALAVLNKEKDAAYKQTALEQILSQDPRPAYKQDKQDLKVYAVQLFDWDVSFQVVEESILVTGIKPLSS